MSWQGLLIIGSILGGCAHKQEHCEAPATNLDSLFSIGDSVLSDLYVNQARQKMYHDSLNGEVLSYQAQLTQKQIKEQRERVVYRDTVVYKKKIKTIIDTIRKHIYLTDTIRDTIFVTIKKERKRKRK